MKNIVMTAAITAICVGKIHAQVPNSIFVMGTGAYESNGSYRMGNLGLGYQLDKHWTLGVIGGSSKVQTHLKWNQIGAFARYSSYFNNSQHFFWFAQTQASYIITTETISATPSYDINNKMLGVSAAGGFGIHFGRGYAANVTPIGLGYNIGLQENYPSQIYNKNLIFTVNIRPEITFSKNISWNKRKSAPAKTEVKE